MEASRIIKERNLKGNILIIHSGGVHSLVGYLSQYEDINLSKAYYGYFLQKAICQGAATIFTMQADNPRKEQRW